MGESDTHILVVDDDTRLRDLLERYLSENGFRVTTAAHAAEARARLKGLRFDLIVLDVMMPGENGVELARSLRAASAVPILLLTAMAEAEDRIAGLESGADDYLTKPFEPRELVLRIETIMRRVAPPPEAATIVSLGAVTFDPKSRELRRDGALVPLTPGEAGLLASLARAAGTTLSREELGRASGLADLTRAVDVQINRLRRKIEPDPKRPRYLQTVWGAGYTLRPD
jgi:two-component system phosphate regulon response regulator OmpR